MRLYIAGLALAIVSSFVDGTPGDLIGMAGLIYLGLGMHADVLDKQRGKKR